VRARQHHERPGLGNRAERAGDADAVLTRRWPGFDRQARRFPVEVREFGPADSRPRLLDSELSAANRAQQGSPPPPARCSRDRRYVRRCSAYPWRAHESGRRDRRHRRARSVSMRSNVRLRIGMRCRAIRLPSAFLTRRERHRELLIIGERRSASVQQALHVPAHERIEALHAVVDGSVGGRVGKADVLAISRTRRRSGYRPARATRLHEQTLAKRFGIGAAGDAAGLCHVRPCIKGAARYLAGDAGAPCSRGRR
jgi:hypothetical protein